MQPQAATVLDQAAFLPALAAGGWEAAGIVLALLCLAALLSAIRLTLARASQPPGDDAGQNGRQPAPPVRARVLGALVLGNILLNTAAAVIATTHVARQIGQEPGPMAAAILALSGCVVFAEAMGRLAVRRGLVKAAFAKIGIRLDRYAQKLSAREEFRGRLESLGQEGDDVVKTERAMLGGLLDLGEMTVEEVMVHRTKMRAIDASLSRDALVREVLASPHTRFPVWRERPDDIVGVLHAKDLFRDIVGEGAGRGFDIEAVLTPPWFVPATTSLRDQLAAFLGRKQHFALVVDEYGDLMGLVTLEDILEEIVGDIADEHDVAARGVRPQPDGSFLVDGSVPIRDLNRMMDWHIPDDEATTLAGLVIHEAQAIPEPGQAFTFHGFRFEVLRRVRNRIAALRVSRLEPEAPRRPSEAA